MTHFPQGTSARPTSRAGIITRTGADWINPPRPLTAWERERRDGSFAQPRPERWRHSLALWLLVLSPIVLAVVL